jgi:tetratricopeptide (TPR) repeat protein
MRASLAIVLVVASTLRSGTQASRNHSSTPQALKGRRSIVYGKLRHGDILKTPEKFEEDLQIGVKKEAQGEDSSGREGDHPDVGAATNDLANVFCLRGEHTRAQEYYQRSLDAKLKALGPRHSSVGNTLNNMGEVYREQGQHAKALEHYGKALDVKLQALGRDHPSVGNTLNNMGAVYMEQGQHAKALEYFQWALEARQNSLGFEHPAVSETLFNMAGLRKGLGQTQLAQKLFLRCAAIFEAAMGVSHPHTMLAKREAALLSASM